MSDVAQLGSRIELVSMDKHFHDITLGLYEQPSADGVPEYIVHSYAGYDGTADRIQFVMRAMQLIGGMEITPGGRLRFVCGDAHRAACRRLFIEASKLASDAEPEARPLAIHDKFAEYASGKSSRAIAKELNANGVQGPGGRLWNDYAIHGNRRRGTGILNNELYVGRLVWNRQRFIKDPTSGKRGSTRRANGSSRMYPSSGLSMTSYGIELNRGNAHFVSIPAMTPRARHSTDDTEVSTFSRV